MRKHYIDYLRLAGIIAVITIHVTARFYSMMDQIGTPSWWLSNLLNSASRFSVPLFVAISGAVLLNRSMSIGAFYKKRALRLLPPLISWTIFYIAFRAYTGTDTISLLWLLKIGLFEGKAYFHMWFFSMFLCLMAFAPFINQFINGNKPKPSDLSVFLAISFLFFLLNWLANISEEVLDQTIYWFKIFPWFVAYFVAGHYIDQYGDKIKFTIPAISMTAAFLILAGAGANYYAAASLGIIKDYFILSNDGPLLFVITFSIFLLARKCKDRLKENPLVSAVSDATFGIYLVHPVFIYLIYKNIYIYALNDLIFIPVAILLTTLGSFATIHLIRKLSFMKALC